MFTDGKDIKTAKVGYSNGDPCSIRKFSVHGPTFGNGCDLICHCNGTWYHNTFTSYPEIGGIPKNFIVNDYEVFQVIKK